MCSQAFGFPEKTVAFWGPTGGPNARSARRHSRPSLERLEPRLLLTGPSFDWQRVMPPERSGFPIFGGHAVGSFQMVSVEDRPVFLQQPPGGSGPAGLRQFVITPATPSSTKPNPSAGASTTTNAPTSSNINANEYTVPVGPAQFTVYSESGSNLGTVTLPAGVTAMPLVMNDLFRFQLAAQNPTETGQVTSAGDSIQTATSSPVSSPLQVARLSTNTSGLTYPPGNSPLSTDPSGSTNSPEYLALPMREGAIPLPDAVSTAVTGSLDPHLKGPIYRLQIDSSTNDFNFNVQGYGPLPPGAAPPVNVYDAYGRLWYKGLLSPSGSMSFDVPTYGPFARGRGQDMYLQIGTTGDGETDNGTGTSQSASGSGTGSGTGSTAVSGPQPTDPSIFSFVLTVTRQSQGTNSSGGSQGGAGTPVSPSQGTTAETPWISPDPSTTSAGAALPGIIEPETLPTDPVQVAIGPLPTRAPAPLGGVLSSQEDPAPRVVGQDEAAVDIALMELQNEDGLPLPPDDAQALGSTGEPVVALRGSGGFPLFGSNLIASGSGSRQISADDLPKIGVQRVSAEPVSMPADLAEVPKVTAEPLGGRTEEGTVRRYSTLACVSVAFAFVSGLVLPDLTDPFRLKSRAERRSSLRRLLRKAEPGEPDRVA